MLKCNNMENNSENFNKPEKKYLYHHVPEKIEGDFIHPLNILKNSEDPKLQEIYKKVIEKYEGRKLYAPDIDVPSLENTKWGDVVQMTPIHPDDLAQALKSAGFELKDKKFYQIDPDTLDLKLTKVYLYSDAYKNPKDEVSDYVDYSPEKLAEHSILPEKVIENYKKEYKERKEKEGKDFDPDKFKMYFVEVPHYFYKGSIDVSNLPIITAKLKHDPKAKENF
jgi:hypothetical protein